MSKTKKMTERAAARISRATEKLVNDTVPNRSFTARAKGAAERNSKKL